MTKNFHEKCQMTKIFQEIENSNSMMRLESKLAGENCIKYWFNKMGWRIV